MAMRKVTRTLFREDEDDDMVNASSEATNKILCVRKLHVTPPVVCRPLQGAQSTSGAENEYNLRSRIVICDSDGQTAERSSGVSGGRGLPEGLVGHSFFMGSNEPRQVSNSSAYTTDVRAGFNGLRFLFCFFHFLY